MCLMTGRGLRPHQIDKYLKYFVITEVPNNSHASSCYLQTTGKAPQKLKNYCYFQLKFYIISQPSQASGVIKQDSRTLQVITKCLRSEPCYILSTSITLGAQPQPQTNNWNDDVSAVKFKSALRRGSCWSNTFRVDNLNGAPYKR